MLLHVFACLPRRCRLLFSTVKHTLPMLVLPLLRSCLSLYLSVRCLSVSALSRHVTSHNYALFRDKDCDRGVLSTNRAAMSEARTAIFQPELTFVFRPPFSARRESPPNHLTFRTTLKEEDSRGDESKRDEQKNGTATQTERASGQPIQAKAKAAATSTNG